MFFCDLKKGALIFENYPDLRTHFGVGVSGVGKSVKTVVARCQSAGSIDLVVHLSEPSQTPVKKTKASSNSRQLDLKHFCKSPMVITLSKSYTAPNPF